MAIKDWFGGDKKKAQFREALKEAVSDGKLTPERKTLNTSSAAEDRTQVRREVFNTAVDAVKSGGKLTAEQAAELQRVQKYLALRDDQVDKTRIDLAHMRKMTEVRQGPLPTVSPDNSALRGLTFEPGELAHYCVVANFLSADEVGPIAGQQVEPHNSYRPGSSKTFALPGKGGTPMGDGVFILTNKRFILKGARATSFPLKQPAGVFAYRDGIRLDFKKKQVLVQFRGENISDVACTILSRLLG
jgi:hypothetical protein